MPSLVSYIAVGAFVVLAMDFVAPPAGIGMSINQWPAVSAQSEEPGTQTVNRTAKQDRLPLAVARQPAAPAAKEPRRVLVGCEPVFSPLSASAHLNQAGRCVAGLFAHGRRTG